MGHLEFQIIIVEELGVKGGSILKFLKLGKIQDQYLSQWEVVHSHLLVVTTLIIVQILMDLQLFTMKVICWILIMDIVMAHLHINITIMQFQTVTQMLVITPLTPVDPIVIWTNATCMSRMVNGSTLHQLIGLLFHHVCKELFLQSMDSRQVKDHNKKKFPLFS